MGEPQLSVLLTPIRVRRQINTLAFAKSGIFSAVFSDPLQMLVPVRASSRLFWCGLTWMRSVTWTLLNWLLARDNAKEDNDDGNHQEKVNQASQGIPGNQAEQP
jgi:hypothetical protein